MSTPELVGRDPDRATVSAAAEAECVYFVLQLGGSIYALDAGNLDHVAPAQRPSRVPTAPAHFAGVVHLRGRIVTVLHMHRLLGLEQADRSSTDAAQARLVVVNTRGGPIGIQADALLGLRHIPADAVRAAGRASEAAAWLVGQFDMDGGVASVVDTDALSETLAGEI